jgi:hypothetical protein
MGGNGEIIMNWYIDQWTWCFLQLYFLPFRMPSIMGETDKWVSSVSMNGARWANMCRPN